MAQQTINLGSVAGDKTGTKLRAGGKIINDNFDELYASKAIQEAVTATPCMGSKYDEFRAAIKYFITKELYLNDLFYVSKIENGVSGHVIVEVSKTSSLSAAGTVVMSSDRTTAAKTGWEIVALSEANTSGLYGIIIIDWDALTAATSYTCANWPEGGLFAVNLYKSGTTGGGGTENIKTITADETDVDGSFDQYYCKPPSADIDITFKAFADIKGNIRLNNASPTYHLNVIPDAAESATSTFNGVTQGSIIVEPLTQVIISTVSAGVFIVWGTYSNPA